MRLITGDECGLLKECIPELARRVTDDDDEAPLPHRGAMPYVTVDGVRRVDPNEIQTRRRGVVDLAIVQQASESLSFCTLRQTGSVELWEGSNDGSKKFGSYDKVFSSKQLFDGKERSRPLGVASFAEGKRICAGDMLGNLSVVDASSGALVHSYHAFGTSKRGETISYTPGKVTNTQTATAMACDPILGRVAMGGRERETTLLDLSTGKVVFKAKNLPPDPQTLLQQPVWPTSIIFLQNAQAMAVGTAYKEVRIYDAREDSIVRRPRSTTPEGLLEYRITALCSLSDYELAVGDSAGNIYQLDTRRLGRDLKGAIHSDMVRFVGPAGSVRSLQKHPTLPRLAAVGLDRMLRVFDTNNRKQLDCVYLKQRLNCVLFAQDGTWGPGSESLVLPGEVDEDIDQDDIVQDYIDSDDDNDTGPQHPAADEPDSLIDELTGERGQKGDVGLSMEEISSEGEESSPGTDYDSDSVGSREGSESSSLLDTEEKNSAGPRKRLRNR